MMAARAGAFGVSRDGNVFAVLRLLPVGEREKDIEILVLRHQIAVLQRQLGSARVRFAPEDRVLKVAASTVWEILKDAGVEPVPQRASGTWAMFLRSQAQAIVACGFLETVTLGGQCQYVLALIEHAGTGAKATRRAHPARPDTDTDATAVSSVPTRCGACVLLVLLLRICPAGRFRRRSTVSRIRPRRACVKTPRPAARRRAPRWRSPHCCAIMRPWHVGAA